MADIRKAISKATQTESDPWAIGNEESDTRIMPRNPEHETTISARVIRTVSVSMSFSEMDMLIGTFGRNRDNFTTGEQRIVDEFVAAVDAIR